MNASEGAGGLYAFGGLKVNGQLLALSAVPATGRTARAVTELEALEVVLPTLGWRRSLFELLLSNVTSERARDRRTGRIEGLGVQFPDPNFTPKIPCSLASEKLARGEFLGRTGSRPTLSREADLLPVRTVKEQPARCSGRVSATRYWTFTTM